MLTICFEEEMLLHYVIFWGKRGSGYPMLCVTLECKYQHDNMIVCMHVFVLKPRHIRIMRFSVHLVLGNIYISCYKDIKDIEIPETYIYTSCLYLRYLFI